MTQNPNKVEYITIVKTREFYNNEKKYHLDAIADIDELLGELPALPPGFDSYDVGGVGYTEEKNEK